MHTAIYLAALAGCAGLAAGATVSGMRKWGVKGLVSVGGLAAGVLLLIGYLDYVRQPTIETPLQSYVLSSVGSTLLTVLVVGVTAGRGVRPVLQLALGGITWLASTLFIISWTLFL